MRRKNPAIAAVLNFFLPGLGFAYLGSRIFIAAGIAFFTCVLVSALEAAEGGMSGVEIGAEIAALLAFATISWEVANLLNAVREKQAATEGPPPGSLASTGG